MNAQPEPLEEVPAYRWLPPEPYPPEVEGALGAAEPAGPARPVSLPGPQQAQYRVAESAAAHSMLDRAVDRVLSIQRPLVLAHLRRVGSKNPGMTPALLTRALERRYVGAVTAGGGGVGAAAAIPGVGTIAALGIASAETVGFLEATALYAHSLAELHGITLRDPDRARILVLTLLLGDEGLGLLRQITQQATGGTSRTSFWGDLVSTSLPKQLVGPLAGQLKDMFIRRAARAGGASVVSKVMPYGIGAVLGGSGNYVMARRVVARSRTAFGPAPHAFPHELAELRAQTAARATLKDRAVQRRAQRAVRRATPHFELVEDGAPVPEFEAEFKAEAEREN